MLNKVLYKEGNITVKHEERNNKNRGKFRRLARQVSGEVFDVPEDNQLLFVYEKQYSNTFLVGQICFSYADTNLQEQGVTFDTEYYSQITFMFVHRDFQAQGFGKLLLTEALQLIKKQTNRNIRLQSAEEAVGFFEKCGFCVIGSPKECYHSGSRLFKTLTDMELEVLPT